MPKKTWDVKKFPRRSVSVKKNAEDVEFGKKEGVITGNASQCNGNGIIQPNKQKNKKTTKKEVTVDSCLMKLATSC